MLEQLNPNVLIVEPSRHFVSLLRHILSVGGIRQAHHAADAYAALEIIKSHQVDIVLLDSDVPGITAVELTRVIRCASDSPNKALPIIILSHSPTRRLIDEANAAGVNFYVKKPLSAQTLLERIKWALEPDHSAELSVACDDDADEEIGSAA